MSKTVASGLLGFTFTRTVQVTGLLPSFSIWTTFSSLSKSILVATAHLPWPNLSVHTSRRLKAWRITLTVIKPPKNIVDP